MATNIQATPPEPVPNCFEGLLIDGRQVVSQSHFNSLPKAESVKISPEEARRLNLPMAKATPVAIVDDNSLFKLLSRMGRSSTNIAKSIFLKPWSMSRLRYLFDVVAITIKPPKASDQVKALTSKLLEASNRRDFDTVVGKIFYQIVEDSQIVNKVNQPKFLKAIEKSIAAGMGKNCLNHGLGAMGTFATNFTEAFERLDDNSDAKSKASMLNFLKTLITDSSMREGVLESFLGFLETDEAVLFKTIQNHILKTLEQGDRLVTYQNQASTVANKNLDPHLVV
ncbi:MAG: hypothetical protein O2962_08900 [Cyanobacteria bacterium]|nr:hypothetical protein [Cyanobacteriota bacterium]